MNRMIKTICFVLLVPTIALGIVGVTNENNQDSQITSNIKPTEIIQAPLTAPSKPHINTKGNAIVEEVNIVPFKIPPPTTNTSIVPKTTPINVKKQKPTSIDIPTDESQENETETETTTKPSQKPPGIIYR